MNGALIHYKGAKN
jgi:hypothetical protein